VMKPRDFQPLHDDGRSRTRTWDLFLIRGAQAVVLAGTWSNLQAIRGSCPFCRRLMAPISWDQASIRLPCRDLTARGEIRNSVQPKVVRRPRRQHRAKSLGLRIFERRENSPERSCRIIGSRLHVEGSRTQGCGIRAVTIPLAPRPAQLSIRLADVSPDTPKA
jgi:hypothetical protein